MGYYGHKPAAGENNSFKILDDLSSYTLTFDGTSSAVVSAANDTLNFNNHRFVQGQRVTYTNGGAANIGGLTTGSVYYIIKHDNNHIKLATSASNASSSTAINLTAVAGSGTSHTLNVAFDGTNTKFKITHSSGVKGNVTRAAQLILSVNGVIQQGHDTPTPSSGYGIDSDSTIVFETAPSVGYNFWGNIVANNFASFEISDNKIDVFTGDGTTKNFSLSKTPPNSENVLVTLDGVVQYPSDSTTTRAYTVVGNSLEFSGAPAAAVDIQARHIGFAGGSGGGSGGGGVTGFYGRTGNVALISTDDIVAESAVIGAGVTIHANGAHVTGVVTATSAVIGAGVTIHANGAHVTGVVTATSFVGALTGNADTATSATNSSHVLVTDNESTNEDNLITFVEGATSSTGNVGLEMDGNLTYNPSTGRLTATQLAGTLQTAAQTNITSVGTLSSLNVSGTVSVGGTLQYEDVTNIDSVGIITARSGIKIGPTAGVAATIFADGSINSTGIITATSFSGGLPITSGSSWRVVTSSNASTLQGEQNLQFDGTDLYMSDGIKHKDDTNTEIGFPANDTFAVTTAAIERFRIRDNGHVSIASSLSVTGVTTSNNYDLSAIDKDISQTAVDVFVYDTRKDSDGGAWRKRTQDTSWYNETLGTSTRGNRREFPAVAVIVATSSNVFIYDGDDPDMPLWMKFDQHGAVSLASNMITLYSNTVHRVKALNGILLVGMTASSQNEGMFEINFITDRGRVYRSEGSGVTGGYYSKAISERNSQTGFHRGDYNDAAIVTQNILSIDMTVLPNAPIDKDTGLPRPSYAVGTDGGATILKSHGEKEFISVDYTNSSSAYRNTDLIQFTEDGGFIFGLTHDNGAEQWMYKYDTLGHTDKSISYHGDGGDLHLMPRRWDSGHATTGVELYYNDNVNLGSGRGRRLANNGKILATYYGLTYIDDKPKDHANGMVAYVTHSYNTGWLHGDVILATLSDTDTTAPTNLVTNGTFDSGTGWSLSGAGAFSISGGKLNGDGTAGDSFAQQAVSPAVVTRYDTYDITFTVTRTAGSVSARVGNSSYTPAVSSSGTFTYSVECGATTTETVLLYGSGFNGTVDDVSVRRNIQDYSKGIVGSKKGLKMAGTVTKTAAATGSDIVAYSGFSASNYMNFDSFNIGTGDFSVSVWCIPSTDGTNEFILELDDASQGSNRMYLLITGTNPPRIYVSWDSDVGGSELETAAWNHIVVGRRSGMGYVYLNGREIPDGTKAFTTSLNGNGMGTIGNYSATPNAGYAWSGKLALLRISKTMPSPEQIMKMYHDEKVLFAPNAKCTIYGTSSDVNAISYDDGTGIIHAGTGQGRSEFNGFVRINNTTDAVTTALSSSNGLVAEE